MNDRVLNYLFGYRRYRVLADNPREVAEQLVLLNLPFWDLKQLGERELGFCASALLGGRLARLAKEENWELNGELLGVPRWFLRYGKRWGAWLGILFFVLFLRFASSRIWEVRLVEGEADGALKEAFARSGLYEGLAAKDFNSALFASGFLAENPEYSYVSAGIHGGVALVWLHPREEPPQDPGPQTGCSNLIAQIQGEVIRCEASYGQVMVLPGDRVQKGQLLVSGIVETKTGGYRLEQASGRVLGKIQREVSVSIPFQSEEKCYTGEEIRLTGINILGKNINFFGFYGKNLEFCDTIDTVEEITFAWGLRLPFTLTRRSLLPYERTTVCRSKEEARRLAFDRYHQLLWEEWGALEVLEENLRLESDETGIHLVGTVLMVGDLAQRQEVGIGEWLLPPGKES